MREEAVDLVLAQVSRMTDVVEEDVTSDPADVGLLGAGAVVPHPNGFPDPIQEFGVAGSRLTGDRNSGGRDTGSAHRWFGRRRTAGCWLPRLMWPKPALAESRDGVRRTPAGPVGPPCSCHALAACPRRCIEIQDPG